MNKLVYCKDMETTLLENVNQTTNHYNSTGTSFEYAGITSFKSNTCKLFRKKKLKRATYCYNLPVVPW